jgi:hypothetical protein
MFIPPLLALIIVSLDTSGQESVPYCGGESLADWPCMPGLDEVSDYDDEDDKEDNEADGDEGLEDPSSTKSNNGYLNEDETSAFGVEASTLCWTGMDQDGYDLESGLPATVTISEDFDHEVHAAGVYWILYLHSETCTHYICRATRYSGVRHFGSSGATLQTTPPTACLCV